MSVLVPVRLAGAVRLSVRPRSVVASSATVRLHVDHGRPARAVTAQVGVTGGRTRRSTRRLPVAEVSSNSPDSRAGRYTCS